ncbi:MAG: hypothetical protein ACK559_11775 [bacterium]
MNCYLREESKKTCRLDEREEGDARDAPQSREGEDRVRMKYSRRSILNKSPEVPVYQHLFCQEVHQYL